MALSQSSEEILTPHTQLKGQHREAAHNLTMSLFCFASKSNEWNTLETVSIDVFTQAEATFGKRILKCLKSPATTFKSYNVQTDTACLIHPRCVSQWTKAQTV